MGKYHTVRAGDCISSIAFEHGLFPDTLWDHPGNAELRARRRSPNILAVGDVVYIPDVRPRSVAVATGQRHCFRRRGVPEKLAIRFIDAQGNARSDTPYEIEIGGVTRTGRTDAAGWLREWIPPDRMTVQIRIANQERYEVALGKLAPIDTCEGIQRRLSNLGYDTGRDELGHLGVGTAEALRRFCADRKLAVPAEWTELSLADVRASLEAAHGA